MRIIINYAWNRAFPFKFGGKSMKTKATAWSKFPTGDKVIVEQTLASEETYPKEQGCESHSQGSV